MNAVEASLSLLCETPRSRFLGKGALVLPVSGSGERVADSSDGTAAVARALVVEYLE